MFRLCALTALVGSMVTFYAAAAEPIPPATAKLSRPTGTLGEVLKDFTAQTGLAVDAAGLDPAGPCPVEFNTSPTWRALELIAEKVQARIALGQGGRGVSLVPQVGVRAASSVDGAFRVAVKQVQCKADFESGKSFVEVTLEVHWEPRIPVFRIDSQPTITAVTADAGTPQAVTNRAKTPPGGRVYTTAIRIPGVPRSATAIRQLAGQFTVTAAPRMLRFDFADLTSPKPVTLPEQAGVVATLKPVQKLDNLWEFPVEVTYPPQPEFESFESWVTENRFQLVGPAGRSLDPSDYDIPDQSRRLLALYRFPGDPAKNALPADRKGWTAVCHTPAPLVEFAVRFDLRDIPLP